MTAQVTVWRSVDHAEEIERDEPACARERVVRVLRRSEGRPGMKRRRRRVTMCECVWSARRRRVVAFGNEKGASVRRKRSFATGRRTDRLVAVDSADVIVILQVSSGHTALPRQPAPPSLVLVALRFHFPLLVLASFVRRSVRPLPRPFIVAQPDRVSHKGEVVDDEFERLIAQLATGREERGEDGVGEAEVLLRVGAVVLSVVRLARLVRTRARLVVVRVERDLAASEVERLVRARDGLGRARIGVHKLCARTRLGHEQQREQRRHRLRQTPTSRILASFLSLALAGTASRGTGHCDPAFSDATCRRNRCSSLVLVCSSRLSTSPRSF